VEVKLRSWVDDEVAIVVAVAVDRRRAALRQVAVHAIPDQGQPSLAARTAAEALLARRRHSGALELKGSWSGGGGSAPQWHGDPPASVSLSHDAGRAVAATLTAVDDPA